MTSYLCYPPRLLVETDLGWYQGDLCHTDIHGYYFVKLDGETDILRVHRDHVWYLDDLGEPN